MPRKLIRKRRRELDAVAMYIAGVTLEWHGLFELSRSMLRDQLTEDEENYVEDQIREFGKRLQHAAEVE